MKKLIGYEVLISFITLSVFFVTFLLMRHYGNVASHAAVAGAVAGAGAAAVAGVIAVGVSVAGIVGVAAAVVGVVAAAAVAGVIAVGVAFVAAIAGIAGIAIVVVAGVINAGDYAKKNGLARKQVVASLAAEFMVIAVPMLLVII